MPKLKKIELNPDEALRELATLQARQACLAAQADAQIAKIKEQFAKDAETSTTEIKALENRLASWIKQNPQRFTSERSHRTVFGCYGLRKSQRVTVSDEKELRDYYFASLGAGQQVDDIGKLVFTPVREGIKNRFLDDRPVPGCELKEKDGPYYEVDQNFLDRLIKGG